MKKIAIIAAALVCLAGCTKSYSPNGYEIVGGGGYYANQPTKDYMMAIVDDMVTDVLDELETAFKGRCLSIIPVELNIFQRMKGTADILRGVR